MENTAFRFWSLEAGTASWYAHPSLRTQAASVVANWQTEVPFLPWLEVESGIENVTIRPENCGGFAACFNVLTFFPEPWRNANYLQAGEILIDLNVIATQDIPHGLAHEVGHFYGLHERYDESGPSCNGNEATVMDGLGCEQPIPTGPLTIDGERVRAFWRVGQGVSLTLSRSGSSLVATWRDEAWSEARYVSTWHVWDEIEARWELAATYHLTYQAGVHRTMEDRAIQNTHGVGPSPIMLYMCVRPWYALSGSSWSPIACTPAQFY